MPHFPPLSSPAVLLELTLPSLDRLTKFTPFPRDALLLSSIYLNRISHLSLPTAYSLSHGETFTDDRSTSSSYNTPQPFIPSYEPARPSPVVVVSPFLQPVPSSSSRSLSSGSLPGFSLSSSPPPSFQALSTSPSSPTSPAFSPSSTSPVDYPSRKLRPAPLLNAFTLHRLLLSTLLIATKYNVDGTLSQTRVSKVGGVSKTELIRLEAESLRLLGWELLVKPNEMEGVLRVWVEKGREMGLIPPSPSQGNTEVRDEEEETNKRETGSISLPPSPPRSAAASISPTTSQHLELPPLKRLHPTLSNTSSSSTSSTSSSSSSCSEITNSTFPSSVTSSPTRTATTVECEGGGGDSTPVSGTKATFDEISEPVRPESGGAQEGESTPTKGDGGGGGR